jgi:hypothetical protein
MGATHFLMKTPPKVASEMALSVLASAIAPPNLDVSVLAFRLMMVKPRHQSQTRHD